MIYGLQLQEYRLAKMSHEFYFFTIIAGDIVVAATGGTCTEAAQGGCTSHCLAPVWVGIYNVVGAFFYSKIW